MARRLAHSNGPRRAAILLFLALAAGGCSAWNKLDPPKAGVALPPDKQSRLTLDNGTRVQVRGLHVDGDTMRFVAEEDSLAHALAASRVVRYEQKDDDIFGTVLLVAGVGVVVIYGYAFIRALGME